MLPHETGTSMCLAAHSLQHTCWISSCDAVSSGGGYDSSGHARGEASSASDLVDFALALFFPLCFPGPFFFSVIIPGHAIVGTPNKIMPSLPIYPFTLPFFDNFSKTSTSKKLYALARASQNSRYLSLTQNEGKSFSETAISTRTWGG